MVLRSQWNVFTRATVKDTSFARSFIESVTEGPKIKLNDVDALMKLETDMVKCQTVLSRLEFTSDLDSTAHVISIHRE